MEDLENRIEELKALVRNDDEKVRHNALNELSELMTHEDFMRYAPFTAMAILTNNRIEPK